MSACLVCARVVHVLEGHDAQPSASQRLEALQGLHVVGREAHPAVRLATLMTEKAREKTFKTVPRNQHTPWSQREATVTQRHRTDSRKTFALTLNEI